MPKEFLRTIWPVFAVVAVLPFLVGLAGSFSFGLSFLLFFLGVPFAFLTAAIWTAVSFVRALRWSREEAPDRGSAAIAIMASPALLGLTLLASWPLLIAGSHVGDLARLGFNHSHYAEIIATVQRNHEAARHEYRGVTYITDPGPPVRVAFNPEGILDNWSGIVFDPTGRVTEADGFHRITGEFAAADEITKLFGGDLVSCRHLWSDYYSCSFT